MKPPEPIGPAHLVADFLSGATALDDFLHRYALASHQAGSARAFVATTDGSLVVGYYSLCASQVLYADAPERLKKGVARHPIPVVLLARLAVDQRWQGQKIGAGLLRDAIIRTLQASDAVGVRALIVHAKDEGARTFYEHFDFEPFPGHPLHLALLLKDARRMLV